MPMISRGGRALRATGRNLARILSTVIRAVGYEHDPARAARGQRRECCSKAVADGSRWLRCRNRIALTQTVYDCDRRHNGGR